MKILKQLLFIILALTFILSSCTMEKRLYMAGYNIEWKNKKHNNLAIPKEKSNIQSIVKSESSDSNNLTASTEGIVSVKRKVTDFKSKKPIISENKYVEKSQNYSKEKKIINTDLQKCFNCLPHLKTINLSDDKKYNSLAVAAFVIFIFSAVLGTYIGIIAGFFQLVSLILAIVALGQLKKNPEQKGRGLAWAVIIIFLIALFLLLLVFSYLI